MIINFLNAPAGSGKTHTLVNHAHNLARKGQKVLFAQPTKALIDATIENELKRLNPNYSYRAIHSNTDPRKAINAIVAAFKNPGPGGQILFITHAALLTVPFFQKASDWCLIVDEVFDVESSCELNIPHSHAILTDLLSVDTSGPEMGSLAAKNGARLRQIANNRQNDEVYQLFQPLAREIVSPHWKVSTRLSSYARLHEGKGGDGKLITHGILQPSILDPFGQVTIASACFEETLLYKLWSQINVEFKSVEALMAKLRYRHHENGRLIDIHYVTEEEWSKVLREKHESEIQEAVRQHLGSAPYVYMTNKSGLTCSDSSAYALPNYPHGMNQFQSIHNAVILSALNPTPAHFKFMEGEGLHPEELRTARYRTAVYQALMRTSARNPSDLNRKIFIVMDRSTGEWLQNLFPGASLSKLPGAPSVGKGKPGRRKVHSGSADRYRNARSEGRARILNELKTLNEATFVAEPYSSMLTDSLRDGVADAETHRCHENTSIIRNYVAPAHATFFRSIYEKNAFGQVTINDEKEFVSFLKELHGRQLESKQNGGLISPASFDPNRSTETARGLENVQFIRGIWMDNDGGDLTPKTFAEIFPHLRMVIYNTHSHTAANPRWRVFIPTSLAMSIDAHQIVIHHIERCLNKQGYWSDADLKAKSRIRSTLRHGFDTGKFSATSLFYLPSQARNPKDSFFLEYNGSERNALDVRAWVEAALKHPTMTLSKFAPIETSEALTENDARAKEPVGWDDSASSVEQAISDWRHCAAGEGNNAFFRLGQTLARAGIALNDIDATLRREAAYGRSQMDRRNQISSVMKTLRKHRSRLASKGDNGGIASAG